MAQLKFRRMNTRRKKTTIFASGNSFCSSVQTAINYILKPSRFTLLSFEFLFVDNVQMSDIQADSDVVDILRSPSLEVPVHESWCHAVSSVMSDPH